MRGKHGIYGLATTCLGLPRTLVEANHVAWAHAGPPRGQPNLAMGARVICGHINLLPRLVSLWATGQPVLDCLPVGRRCHGYRRVGQSLPGWG